MVRKLTTFAEEVSEALLTNSEVLSEREIDIIKRYYGLDNYTRHTLDEIGQHYEITRERVRQVKSVALNKMGISAREA